MRCSDDNPEGVRDKLVPAFLRGISSHHAGCLPAWKSLVERCFQKGLLKLVFATGAASKHTPALLHTCGGQPETDSAASVVILQQLRAVCTSDKSSPRLQAGTHSTLHMSGLRAVLTVMIP